MQTQFSGAPFETSAGLADDGTGVEWQVCEAGGGDCVAVLQPHPEAEARANAFAAAPDLLAAGKRALPWLGRLIADGAHLNCVLPRDAEAAMRQMQAAIARAEGGAA